MPYFKDDGTEFNPDLMPKPSLCATCKNDERPEQEIACNLNRSDQDEDIFLCFSYESVSGQATTDEVLQEMKRYMDGKYGEHGEKRNANK